MSSQCYLLQSFSSHCNGGRGNIRGQTVIYECEGKVGGGTTNATGFLREIGGQRSKKGRRDGEAWRGNKRQNESVRRTIRKEHDDL